MPATLAIDGLGAEIDGTNTVTVDSSGDSAMFINMGENASDNSTLNISDGDLTVSDPAGTVGVNTANSQVFRIGAVAGGSGTVNQSGGTVTINGVDPSIQNGIDGHLYVGDNGNGTYNLTGGSITASDEIWVAIQNGSTGVINASAGTMSTTTRALLLGMGAGDPNTPGSGSTGTLNASGTATINIAGDAFVGFNTSSVGNLTVSDSATVNVYAQIFTNLLGSNGVANITVSGGTLNTGVGATADNGNQNFLLGTTPSTTTLTLSGGTINTDYMFNGFNAGGTTTVNQTGGTVNGLGIIVGERGDATYNQSAGAIVANSNPSNSTGIRGEFTVGEAGGAGTYNLSGTGTLTTSANFYVGRLGVGGGSALGSSGTGTINQSGGSITVGGDVYIGNFDGTTGIINHSGGGFHVIGDMNIAGDLADNGGQAINVRGTFTDTGNSGSIQVDGDLYANSGENTRTDGANGTSGEQTYLNFGLDTTGVTLFNVTGGADLTGAIIDVYAKPGVVLPVGVSFPLLSAGGGITGTYFDPNDALISLAVTNNTLYATVLLAPLLGDTDRNGTVDSADYETLLNSFSTHKVLGGWASGDFNGDGVVNGDDWALFELGLAAYNSGQPITVPEPASLGLFLAAGLGLVTRRRRA